MYGYGDDSCSGYGCAERLVPLLEDIGHIAESEAIEFLFHHSVELLLVEVARLGVEVRAVLGDELKVVES